MITRITNLLLEIVSYTRARLMIFQLYNAMITINLKWLDVKKKGQRKYPADTDDLAFLANICVQAKSLLHSRSRQQEALVST